MADDFESNLFLSEKSHLHRSRVPDLIDQFISVIHENWDINKHPTELAAFALWRLNWIHPFIEGNGRTARAACYYLICMMHGKILGGQKTMPERIRENRDPYIDALREADDYLAKTGQWNVSALADYLADLLEAHLRDDA